MSGIRQAVALVLGVMLAGAIEAARGTDLADAFINTGADDTLEAFATLVRNARKGDPYRVKLVDDPIVYEGIPLAAPGATTQDVDAFRLQITSPPEKAGPAYGRIHEIEWLERVSPP